MRKLGELDVVGTCVRVYHATQTESGDELDSHTFGCFVAHSATIYLQRWSDYRVEPTALWGVAMHEALHAMFWEAGAYLALKDACPKWTLEAREHLEERIVTALSPAIAVLIATRAEIEGFERCAIRAALDTTDARDALRDACPDYSEDALNRLSHRLAERLARGLASALPGLKQLHASIKKVSGSK